MFGKLFILTLVALQQPSSVFGRGNGMPSGCSPHPKIAPGKGETCPELGPQWQLALKTFESGTPENFHELERLSARGDNEFVRELARLLVGLRDSRRMGKEIEPRWVLPREPPDHFCIEKFAHKKISGRLLLICVTLNKCGRVIEAKLLRGTSDPQLNECFRENIERAVFLPFFDGQSFSPHELVLSVLLEEERTY